MSCGSKLAVVDAVFARRRLPKFLLVAQVWGWSLAALAHGAGLWWIARTPVSKPQPTWPQSIEVQPAPVVTPVPAQEPPPQQDPPTPAAPPPAQPDPAPAKIRAKPSKPASARPARAPAAAAKIHSAKAPVDLTSTPFITGSAGQFRGGVTQSQGQRQGPGQASGSSQVPAKKPGSGLQKAAQPPRFAGGKRLDCPWPKAAMQQDIYAQQVVLRVRVDKRGQVKRVHLHEDPGFGFAKAARACAKELRFEPAKNARGQAIEALSPPIRIRFRR